MARKPQDAAPAAVQDDDAPEMVSVTILAEGVRVDGSGHLPVGITVAVTPKVAQRLKAAGQAE